MNLENFKQQAKTAPILQEWPAYNCYHLHSFFSEKDIQINVQSTRNYLVLIDKITGDQIALQACSDAHPINPPLLKAYWIIKK